MGAVETHGRAFQTVPDRLINEDSGRRGEGRRGVPDSDREARGCFGRDALPCVSNRSSASSSVQNEGESE